MASGCNAATGSVIGASGSYRTTIARAARRASSAVSAATIATGSPTYRTLPTASATPESDRPVEALEMLPGEAPAFPPPDRVASEGEHRAANAAPAPSLGNDDGAQHERLRLGTEAQRADDCTVPRRVYLLIGFEHHFPSQLAPIEGFDFRATIVVDASHRGHRRNLPDDARSTASRILPYPVQRQMLPESASRTSCSLGSGLRLSNAYVATTRPGVQNPHWTAPASTNARCTGCSLSSSENDSTVWMLRSAAAAPSTRHAHTRSPSIITEQDPHSPCSHAFLLPASPRFSRRTVRRLSWSAASASRSSPLTVSLILMG